MYTLDEIESFRDEAGEREDTEYCNVLSSELFSLIYPGMTKYENIFEDENDDPLSFIRQELLSSSVVFVQLANSSGEEKTFIHEFVLFLSEDGIYRIDSYGKDETLTWNKDIQKVEVSDGYCLYKGSITLWDDWEEDLRELITSPAHGGRFSPRLELWNRIFSSVERYDLNEGIDIVVYLPYEQD